MKLVDAKQSTYIDSSQAINDKDPKFKIADTVRILKYKNIFSKAYVTNWSKDVSVIKKVKTLCQGHMLSVILKANRLLERFTKKNYKKQIKKNLEMKK